jgi:hypothetical protein
MIIDSRLEFADADTGVAAAAGTVLLDNQLDMSVVRDIGAGQPLYLVITCDTSIITGGSAGTITFRLVSDDSATIHASTCSIHLVTQAFVTDDEGYDCVAGDIIFCGAIPSDGQEPYEQYLGVQAVIATTTITAGAVSAFLTLDPIGVRKAYADGI